MKLSGGQLILISSLLFFVWPAYGEAQIEPFFSLTPAKKEISLAPGEEVFIPLTITNRLGKSADFNITIEDIAPTQNPEEVIEVIDGRDGPYSLKNFISLTENHLYLLNGEEKTISFLISLPTNVPPGSLHGGIFVNTANVGANNVKTVSRIGSLLFVKVRGDVNESGQLKDFFITKQSFWSTLKPIRFQIFFANDGNSYLNPYGVIAVKNIFGRTVKQIPITPWFVLPASERLREIETKLNGFGPYTATISLNRGYDNVVDSKMIRFWQWSWPVTAIIFLILIILIFLIIRLKRKRHA